MTSKIIGRSSVKIDPISGLIRIDGIIVCKKVTIDGRTFLQFKDSDRMRASCRKSALVELPLADFVAMVENP